MYAQAHYVNNFFEKKLVQVNNPNFSKKRNK